MAYAIEQGNQEYIDCRPKYVPRGRLPDWYRARARAMRNRDLAAREMENLQRDLRDEQYLASLPEHERQHILEERLSIEAGWSLAAFERIDRKYRRAVLDYVVAEVLRGLSEAPPDDR